MQTQRLTLVQPLTPGELLGTRVESASKGTGGRWSRHVGARIVRIHDMEISGRPLRVFGAPPCSRGPPANPPPRVATRALETSDGRVRTSRPEGFAIYVSMIVRGS